MGRPREEELSYMGAHQRVRRARGPAKEYPCEFCGAAAYQWSYRGGSALEQRGPHSPAHATKEMAWSPEPSDYDPLCVSCHRALDGLIRRFKNPATARRMLHAT